MTSCSTNILPLFAMVCLVICTKCNQSCNTDVHYSIVCQGRGPLNAFTWEQVRKTWCIQIVGCYIITKTNQLDLRVPTWAFWVVQWSKNLPAKAGDARDVGLIPES